MKAPRLSLLMLPALLIGLALNVGAQESKKPALISSDLTGGDMQFLVSAAEQGNVQAALGELAVTHAESDDVKTFGRSLAKENAIQNEQIKLLAINKGLSLPENLNPKKNPALDKLGKLQGLKFDKAYLTEMLAQLENYEAIFARGVQSHDPDIKAFATSALPAIQAHLAFLNHTTGNAPVAEGPPAFRAAQPAPPDSASH